MPKYPFIGLGPSKQVLFLLEYPLTEDAELLKDLPQKTIYLVLPKDGGERDRTEKGPRKVKEVFLIKGTRSNFEAILLQANKEHWIKLKSGRQFGVVKHIEGEEIGKRMFKFWVYELKKEGSIALRTEDGNGMVYLVIEEGPNGEEDGLTPINTKTYDEKAKVSKLDKAGKLANICH